MNAGQRILFISNTYMQLITAIQLKLSMFNDAQADLILSDHSVNAHSIAKRLQTCGIFSRVHNVNSRKIMYEQGKLADLKDIMSVTFHFGKKFKSMLWQDTPYHAIFYYNLEPLLFCAYDESVKNGVKPQCICYEEGILSYANIVYGYNVPHRMKAIHYLRGLLHKENISDLTKDFYIYYPELFPNDRGVCHKIPHLSREDHIFIKTVNTIFDYHPEEEHYPQKYLFFASSADIDGNPAGETELVMRVSDIVGKENLLVKVHPRDSRHIYEEHGIAVSRNSAIPWEVIQLNHHFEDHVFLSVSSGSVLNASAMLGDHIPTFYLYPLIKGKNTFVDRYCEQNVEKNVCALQKAGVLQETRIVNNLREICAGTS